MTQNNIDFSGNETESIRKEALQSKRKWANRVIFIGKSFILVSVLFLAYLLWSIRSGYGASPEDKFEIGKKIIPFEIVDGYTLSFASDGFLSKIVVLDNSSTKQRIVLNRVFLRKERTSQGFDEKFNHPNGYIKLRKSTFTGIENPKVLAFGKIQGLYHEISYALVESKTGNENKKGIISCLYCPESGKSFFIESVAPTEQFSEKEVMEFLDHIGKCHES